MTLAYTPIAVTTPNISIEALERFMRERGEKHYTGCWHEAPLCGRVGHEAQLLESTYRDQAWLKRFDSQGPVQWASQCDELLPQVKEVLLSLPIQITYCNLLLQIAPVPPHVDVDHRHEAHLKIAPQLPLSSYKWLLSGTSLKSFYVQRDKVSDDTRRHIQLPKGHALFAISDTEFVHGADFIPESKKFILSIFGIVNSQKHKELIEKSIKQFEAFTISF